MDFKDIVGQEVLIQSLQNAIRENMVANAYIFNGPTGSGKKTVAEIFARAINCRDIKYRPCNLCSSCKKTISKSNPDIIYIKPSGNSIKIDQVRHIIVDTSIKPYESSFRVTIIENGDKLTPESQDAFLKTLEEPEKNNIFILLTENYNSLLPTIISRCQVFNFLRINGEKMRLFLSNHGFVNADEIEFAIANSDGIIGRAIEILKSKDFRQHPKEYGELLEIIQEGSREEIFRLSESLVQNKEDGAKLLRFLLSFFRDILILKDVEDIEYIINQDINPNIIKGYSENFGEENLFYIIDLIKQIIRSMDFNVNMKNSVDSLLLRILEVCNDKGSRSTV
ncbi:MAG: AAA family ATPase [Lutispora sp.]